MGKWESSGRQQSGVCPLRNQRRGRDAVFGREERVCELRLQYRLSAQAVSECIPEQSYTRKSHPKPAKARKQRRKVVGKGSALFPPNRQKCCQKLWKNCQTCPCLCLGIPRKSFPRTLLRVRKWESASPEVVWFKVKKTWFSWFSYFCSLVPGVLWLLPVCSAPLDAPVTFCAWPLLPSWQCHPSKFHLLIKTDHLSCPSSLHVFFSEFLSTRKMFTGSSLSNFLSQEKIGPSPTAAKLVPGISSLVLFVSFIVAGQDVV